MSEQKSKFKVDSLSGAKRTAFIMSDLHLRPEEYFFAVECLKKAEKEIEELKPRYLFILGDTFHTKTTTNTTVMLLLEKFLLKISKKLEEIVIIVGNHDWGIPYEDHSLDLYKRIPNVKIVDTYYLLDKKNLFLSYCREPERFTHLVESANKESNEIIRLFAHLDINGFNLGSGWEEKNTYLNPESLSNYMQVFTGHYHLAQDRVIGDGGTEISYIGSAYTTDFGESNQKKRFILLDLDSGNWKEIDTGLTYHFTDEINAGDPYPTYDIDKIRKGIKYRLKISGTKEEIALLEKKPDDVPREVKITYSFKKSEKKRIDLSEKENDTEVMTHYAKTEIEKNYQGLDKSGFDLEKLVEKGKKYL